MVLQLFLLLWIKKDLCILDMAVNRQSSLVGCCWSSRKLSSWQYHAFVRELYRALSCSLLSSCSFGLLLFYTGACTTLICPIHLFLHPCTITTGVYVKSCLAAPGKHRLKSLYVWFPLFYYVGHSCFCLQNRLWISGFFFVFLSSGQHLTDEKQKTCMYERVCVYMY